MTGEPRALAARPAGPGVPIAELGEGPCWDAGSQSLYWVDIPAGTVTVPVPRPASCTFGGPALDVL